MKQKTTSLFILFLLNSFSILTAQKLPSTLLWKITGNGLQQPCYLYGTMHLTDERIFNLGDSLYKAIENSNGFAIEIDPEEFTPLVIDVAKKSVYEEQRIKEVMSEDEFKKYGKSLSLKLNKNENDITTADILREKNKWINDSYSKGEMQTFLDIYLFEVARKEGKWTGGVEDLQDQEGLLEDAIDEADIQQLAESDKGNGSKNQEGNFTEQFIRFYMESNLNAIDSITALGDSTYNDKLLTRRNFKMANRMDSIGHQRSMVFAVGAAHLPGHYGLIALLKGKGFTVTPIFSSKKIKPEDYKIVDKPLPWHYLADDNGYYSDSMPGKPGDMTLYGLINMKVYFDVFNSTIYLATALKTPYSDKMADSVFGNVANYYFGTNDYHKGKSVVINNVPGKEFQYYGEKYSRGYLLFKDGMMYMAIAQCMKKDSSGSTDMKKFLHSFHINNSDSINRATNSYFTYIDQSKGFSVQLPDKPKSAADFVKTGKDSSVSRNIYVCADPKSGAYFFFGANNAAKGYFVENDSINLINIKANEKSKISDVLIDTAYIKNNHRVLEFGGMMNNAPLMMKSYYESRGNSWYSLLAMYDTATANPAVENFFKSFTVLNYPAHEWNIYAPDEKEFSTWAPSNFDNKTSGSDSDFNYTAFDSSRSDTYMVLKQSFSKYYWQKNDSDLWQKLIPQSSDYSDSLLSKKTITNGSIPGYEITLQEGGSVNIKRKRMILNDGKLFTLLTVQPASEIYNDNNNKFFDEFRFSNTASNANLFVSKATLLLNDFSSNDSSVRADAKSFLGQAPFSNDEMPLLYEALLKKYPSDENEDNYEDTRISIQKKIIDLDDSASISIAKDDYFKADDETKNLLLGIMVSFPTAKNFNDIKTLLLQQPPKEKLSMRFINGFTDSLELASNTFPYILPLVKDSFMTPGIIRIAKRLLDSNMLPVSSLLPFMNDILQFSRRQFRIAKNASDDDYDYTNNCLIEVLGGINNVDCNSALQNWSTVKQSELQLESISDLLRNKQAVKPESIEKLAENKLTRTDLYDSLKVYKKGNLFPNEFLNQKSFAESYVFSAASEDETPSLLNYLTQKIIRFKGRQSRFFFYKITYGTGDSATFSLGSAGPFTVNSPTFSNQDVFGNIYDEENFDPENLPSQMDALIKQMEDGFEWENEKQK